PALWRPALRSFPNRRQFGRNGLRITLDGQLDLPLRPRLKQRLVSPDDLQRLVPAIEQIYFHRDLRSPTIRVVRHGAHGEKPIPTVPLFQRNGRYLETRWHRQIVRPDSTSSAIFLECRLLLEMP